MRDIGLDVHRDFCEVAISENGELRSAGRIETTLEALELFAGSLGSGDRVALEVTGNAWEIARIIEPHVAPGARRQPVRHRDQAGAGEDRPARRPRAGTAAGRGLARRPLAAGRADERHAAATRPSRPARPGADARQERGPRGR